MVGFGLAVVFRGEQGSSGCLCSRLLPDVSAACSSSLAEFGGANCVRFGRLLSKSENGLIHGGREHTKQTPASAAVWPQVSFVLRVLEGVFVFSRVMLSLGGSTKEGAFFFLLRSVVASCLDLHEAFGCDRWGVLPVPGNGSSTFN